MTDHSTAVPHFNVHTATYDPAPEVNGFKKWLYESPDGARRAGSFKEHGRFDVVTPCDEFLYVVAGSTRLTLQDGETFELTAGGCCFLRKGLTVTFETSADYHDVSVFMSLDDNDSGA
ncbi:cupin domain-containing protein [Nocardia sp. NPDC052254]|uniref:cupin domain-containing protein n=1 Tax=Nocardia sp. NPDC052254 TaxID=3155681 RepID=UPI00341B2E95